MKQGGGRGVSDKVEILDGVAREGTAEKAVVK